MLGFIITIIGLVIVFAGLAFAAMENGIVFLVLAVVGLLTIIAGFLANTLPRKKVRKHRTAFTTEYKCNPERVQFAIDLFMKENEYERLQYNDEEVFLKGRGWLLARRFIKCTINDDNTVLIEGWVSSGMGKAASTEEALTGFYAMAPKKILTGEIQELQARISNLAD